MAVMLIFIVFYPQKFLAAQGDTTLHKMCSPILRQFFGVDFDRLHTQINFQKYVDSNCAKLWSLTSEAPLKGHPQGVPCAELAVRSTDWGVSTYVENVVKRFYESTSPPPNGDFPLSLGEAIVKIDFRENCRIALDKHGAL